MCNNVKNPCARMQQHRSKIKAGNYTVRKYKHKNVPHKEVHTVLRTSPYYLPSMCKHNIYLLNAYK